MPRMTAFKKHNIMRVKNIKDKSRRYLTMIFSGKQMHDGYDSAEEYTTRWTFKNNHYRRPKDIADDKMYTVTFKTGKVTGVDDFDGCRMMVARYEETPKHIVSKFMAKDAVGILPYVIRFHEETMGILKKQ